MQPVIARFYIVLLFCLVQVFGYAQQHTRYLKVHFIYGSKPLREFKDSQKKWFGGIMGGHVGIEGDSGQIRDFLIHGKLHIFSRKNNKHSRYNRTTVKEFYKTFEEHPDSVKKAIVYIPVTSRQMQQFDSITNGYLSQTPYDYAFIGMRCAASSYEVLGQLGIVPSYSSYPKTYWRIFYPKKLRKRLFKEAEKNDWIVDSCPGSCMRKWEQD